MNKKRFLVILLVFVCLIMPFGLTFCGGSGDFDEEVTYTITFKDYDGEVLSKKNGYKKGDIVVEPEAPTRASDETYNYTFAGWDSEVVVVSKNKTYTATYTKTIIKKASEELKYTLSNDGTYYTISGIGTCTDTDIIIPNKFNGKPVKSIDESAFKDCSSLTSVTFGENSQLTSIGNYAFYDCSNLTSIEIPSSVTNIGEGAFCDCSNLTSVTFGENNQLTSIGFAAFSDCNSLTSIVIPNSITSIGWCAFLECSSLNYNIYDNGKYLGNSENPYLVLVEAVNTSITSCIINGNTKIICSHVFYFCSSLEYNIYDNGKYLGNSENPYLVLVEAVNKDITSCNINDNTKIIAYDAFSGCSSLTSIEIPSSVTSIGEWAFEYCSSLTSVTFGENSQLTSIGYSAFYNCSSLTSIEIPERVTSIGDCAFSDCSRLISINVETGNANYKSIEGNLYTKNGKILIQYAIGKTATEFEIPSAVTSIGDCAFRHCSNLTSVTFGENSKLTSIGEDAFWYCSSLTSIGEYAFWGCSNLTSIVIQSSVTIIEDNAFYSCSSLTSVVIPSSVTSIGKDAFYGCSSLNYNIYDNGKYLGNSENPYLVLVKAVDRNITSCNINSNTKIIYEDAFSSCSSLKSIVIPSSVTSIGDDAFRECSRLTSVTFGENSQLTSIGEDAFYNCISLTNIKIPSSVTSIGNSAFSDCSSLTSIKVETDNKYYKSIEGNLYTKDGKTLFQYAIGKTATTFEIPSSVTSIADSAFSYCRSLTSIEIPSSVTSIGEYAFEDCSSLTSITFGKNSKLTSIGSSAFYYCSSLQIVYYGGTSSDWNNISINSSNSYLTSATRYYYSETQPTEDGNYWHYAEDGKTVVEW